LGDRVIARRRAPAPLALMERASAPTARRGPLYFSASRPYAFL